MTTAADDPIIEFHIATSVLEAIVRGAVKGEPLVQLHSSGLGRPRSVEVQVENGSCRATVHLEAAFGEPLVALGTRVMERIRTALERTTGLTVASVDVVFEGVLPKPEAE
jgi:uncharacterized alkaline shock family protein YloU